jgi:O-acetyl-ADP-ribose deacetylase (regulator of RNase III)
MKIIYKQGDVLGGPEPWVLHGCNAQGVMGSGVALAVKKKYPSAYTTYLASAQQGGMRLGVVTFAVQENGLCVFNGITQEFYGHQPSWGKTVYVSYDAVTEVMAAMDYCAKEQGQDWPIEVAMPKIGAGLGGGDWDTIAEIIEQGSNHFQPVVYTL